MEGHEAGTPAGTTTPERIRNHEAAGAGHRSRLAFIGAGAMARALIHGVLDRGLYRPDEVQATNRDKDWRLRALEREAGIRTTRDVKALVTWADAVILATKPPDAPDALARIAPYLAPRHWLVSVVAGLPLSSLARQVPAGVRLVRTMPNCSCQVGEGATAIALGPGVVREAARWVEEFFGAVGRVVVVPEPALDAVTGLSGSGPAYVYRLVEAMAAAGAAEGLDPGVALELAVQTVVGAGAMLRVTGQHPEELRRQVMSPGGTTVAGLAEMERRGFERAVLAGIRAAARRARELGRAADAPAQNLGGLPVPRRAPPA